jgi:hypothetical protein
MDYELLANVVMVLHALLIVSIFLGILFSIKIRWFRPVESFALLTAIVIWSIFGGCPLTFVENYLRLHTSHPIPLSTTGFIPYYLYNWFGLQLSNSAFVLGTYLIALLFFFIDLEWLSSFLKRIFLKKTGRHTRP